MVKSVSCLFAIGLLLQCCIAPCVMTAPVESDPRLSASRVASSHVHAEHESPRSPSSPSQNQETGQCCRRTMLATLRGTTSIGKGVLLPDGFDSVLLPLLPLLNNWLLIVALRGGWNRFALQSAPLPRSSRSLYHLRVSFLL